MAREPKGHKIRAVTGTSHVSMLMFASLSLQLMSEGIWGCLERHRDMNRIETEAQRPTAFHAESFRCKPIDDLDLGTSNRE